MNTDNYNNGLNEAAAVSGTMNSFEDDNAISSVRFENVESDETTVVSSRTSCPEWSSSYINSLDTSNDGTQENSEDLAPGSDESSKYKKRKLWSLSSWGITVGSESSKTSSEEGDNSTIVQSPPTITDQIKQDDLSDVEREGSTSSSREDGSSPSLSNSASENDEYKYSSSFYCGGSLVTGKGTGDEKANHRQQENQQKQKHHQCKTVDSKNVVREATSNNSSLEKERSAKLLSGRLDASNRHRSTTSDRSSISYGDSGKTTGETSGSLSHNQYPDSNNNAPIGITKRDLQVVQTLLAGQDSSAQTLIGFGLDGKPLLASSSIAKYLLSYLSGFKQQQLQQPLIQNQQPQSAIIKHNQGLENQMKPEGLHPPVPPTQYVDLANLKQNQHQELQFGMSGIFPSVAVSASRNPAADSTSSPSSNTGSYGSTNGSRDGVERMIATSYHSSVLIENCPILYIPRDDEVLIPFHRAVRKLIHFFEAKQNDAICNSRGRVKPVIVGQVGIRCIHCAAIPPKKQLQGATYFPAKLDLLYQAAHHMIVKHICGKCPNIPLPIKDNLCKLKGGKSQKGTGKTYWANAARDLGVCEGDGILYFENKSRITTVDAANCPMNL